MLILTVPIIIIPITITVILLYFMIRTIREESCDYDSSILVGIIFGFPILVVWILYLLLYTYLSKPISFFL